MFEDSLASKLYKQEGAIGKGEGKLVMKVILAIPKVIGLLSGLF